MFLGSLLSSLTLTHSLSSSYISVKTRRRECDRPGVEPTTSGCNVWGQYHSSEKVSCDKWYWNPCASYIGIYVWSAARRTRPVLLTTHTPMDVPMNDPDTSSGLHVWGQYHSHLKRSAVISGTWYWNPSPHISGHMCGARRVVRGLCCSQQYLPTLGSIPREHHDASKRSPPPLECIFGYISRFRGGGIW